MNKNKNEIIFKLLFENTDAESLIEFLTNGSARSSDPAPNPFADKNLGEIFWRLSRCEDVFTEEARASYKQLSEVALAAVDIEVEAEFDIHQKVSAKLNKLMPR